MKTKTISFSDEQFSQLQQLATSSGTTTTALIKVAIQDFLRVRS